MPIPKGLHFDNRLAAFRDGYLFVCQRKGHPQLQKYLELHLTDAKAFRAAHDTAYHNVMFRHLGFEPAKNVSIEELCQQWKDHCEELEVQGSMHWKTTRHYFYCADRMIRPAFKAAGVRTVREIDPSKISAAIAWMKKNTASRGGSIIKALTALRTMTRWKGLPIDWKIPHGEIKARRAEKRDLDAHTIARLIRAMPDGSLEQAITLLKCTGARDVEVYEARREEFDLDVRMRVGGRMRRFAVFAPMLHSKRRQKPHVYVLTERVAKRLRPFVEAAEGRIFTFDGGRAVTPDGLRKRFIAASKRAGIDPPIQTVGPIRAEIITLTADDQGMEQASQHVAGHAQKATTARWYYKGKMTPKKLQQRLRIATAIERAIPARGRL